MSQGDPGQPLGRAIQIAEILSLIKHQSIKNVVWVTTDVHYTAAHYFDPDRAAYKDFDPFWQFVTGPPNAGAFPADAVDVTFGPEQVFLKASSDPNGSSPATEFQFFGQICIDAASQAMTVRVRDNSNAVLWSKELPAERR